MPTTESTEQITMPNQTDPRLAYIPGIEAELFVPPSREQWFWVRKAGWLFAPAPGQESRLARWFGIFTVVPSTNVTNFSLRYQSYLNDIFHTTPVARIGHAVAMPCIVILLSLAVHTLGGEMVAVLFQAGLTVWWLSWAAIERDWVWGLALALFSALVWLASSTLAAHAVAPWLPLAACAAIQMLSHVLEPLPPRVSRLSYWTSVRAHLTRGSLRQRLLRIQHVVGQMVFGAIAEILASPRLICVIVLELLWLCGHRSEMKAEWKAASRKAVASGNPALDYIGVGGATPLRWR